MSGCQNNNVLVFEQEKCVGCRRCEYACSFKEIKDNLPRDPRISNHPFRKSAQFISVMCMQCREPVCMEVCPVGAISRNEKGIVTVDEQRCIGCKMCVMTCPFGGALYSPALCAATKCDLCGGDPECVKACPTGALRYMQPQEFAMERRERIAKHLTELYGKECI